MTPPDDLLEADDLAAELGCSVEWIKSRALIFPCVLHWGSGRVQVRRADVPMWRDALAAGYVQTRAHRRRYGRRVV